MSLEESSAPCLCVLDAEVLEAESGQQPWQLFEYEFFDLTRLGGFDARRRGDRSDVDADPHPHLTRVNVDLDSGEVVRDRDFDAADGFQRVAGCETAEEQGWVVILDPFHAEYSVGPVLERQLVG